MNKRNFPFGCTEAVWVFAATAAAKSVLHIKCNWHKQDKLKINWSVFKVICILYVLVGRRKTKTEEENVG